MDTGVVTAPEVAQALGVSLPTAHRAMDSHGIARAGRGHARVAPQGVLDALVAEHGSTPPSAYSASELKVLATLSRSPLGQPSIRAIARRSALSPTTVSGVIDALVTAGLVAQREVVVAAGSARRETRWFANLRSWPQQLRHDIFRTRLPEPSAPSPSPLPHSLRHWFWNADVAKLDPAVHGSYMAGRLLASPDVSAWLWAVTNIARDDIATALSRRNVDPKMKAWVEHWWAHAS